MRYEGLERGGEGKLVSNGHRVSVYKDEKVLEVKGGDGCGTM